VIGFVDVIALGAINWDINIWVDEFPHVGEEVPVKRVTRLPGGKAANVATAAARISEIRKVCLLGALGKDDIARTQIDVLGKEGVDTSQIKFVGGVESGQAYITIDRRGANVIETLFGANHEFFPEDLLQSSRLSVIKECKVIAISDPLIPTAEKLAVLGNERGATILYDGGTKLEAGPKKLKRVLSHTSILVMNSAESYNLTKSTDPLEVRNKLKASDIDLGVIVKLGEKGCAYADRKDEKVMLPALKLKELGLMVINTVGCGDTFLGVFAASLAQGYSEIQSLERANTAGGLKAANSETRGSPCRGDLEKMLEVSRKRN
jgi:ribokinase